MLLAYDETARRVGAASRRSSAPGGALRPRRRSGPARRSTAKPSGRGASSSGAAIDADDRGNLLWVRRVHPRSSRLPACASANCARVPDQAAPPRPGTARACRWSRPARVSTRRVTVAGDDRRRTGTAGGRRRHRLGLQHAPGRHGRRASRGRLCPTTCCRRRRSGWRAALAPLRRGRRRPGRTAETAQVAMGTAAAANGRPAPRRRRCSPPDVDPASLHWCCLRDAPGFAPWLVGQRFDGSLLAARY